VDAALEVLGARGGRRVGDLQRAEAAIADVARLEWIGGLALLALQGICRHVVNPPPGLDAVGGVAERGVPFTASPRPSSWSLIGIATVSASGAEWLAGVHRASPPPPLDAYCYVRRQPTLRSLGRCRRPTIRSVRAMPN